MSKNGKIIITGPGRAGTTNLVRILTRLGFDTGMTVKTEEEYYNREIRAGCEIVGDMVIDYQEGKEEQLKKELWSKYPRILKAPDFATHLKFFLYRNLIDLDYVIMPIRDLEETAKSRMQHPDLHWHSDSITAQLTVLRVLTGSVIEACVLYNIPLLLLKFPDNVKNWNYLFDKMCIVFPNLKKRNKEFKKAFDEVNNDQ